MDSEMMRNIFSFNLFPKEKTIRLLNIDVNKSANVASWIFLDTNAKKNPKTNCPEEKHMERGTDCPDAGNHV